MERFCAHFCLLKERYFLSEDEFVCVCGGTNGWPRLQISGWHGAVDQPGWQKSHVRFPLDDPQVNCSVTGRFLCLNWMKTARFDQTHSNVPFDLCSPVTYRKDMLKVIGDPVDHHKFPENHLIRKNKRKKALRRWEKHFG